MDYNFIDIYIYLLILELLFLNRNLIRIKNKATYSDIDIGLFYNNFTKVTSIIYILNSLSKIYI